MEGIRDPKVYIKAELLFAEEPDWDVLILGIQKFREGMHAQVEVQRAEKAKRGFRLPLFISSHLMRRRPSRRDEAATEDIDAKAEFLEQTRDALEGFFGCHVEFTELFADMQHPEDLAIIDEAFGRRRDRIFGPPQELTGDDLRPESEREDNGLDPYEELDSLVGLNEIKEQVKGLARLVSEHGKETLPCMHMVFRGNPGTGKTTVARIIGKIFDEAGITDGNGNFVETDRAGLIGQYVGQTAPKTARAIKKAQGGILFIDEAYSLGMYDTDRDYGSEALATLVKGLEDQRNEFVCIMAGYPVEMDIMISKNPGLQDRIGFYIDFPDYTSEELMEVFKRFARLENYRVSKGAQQKLEVFLQKVVAAKSKDFSNARIVRKIFERIRMDHLLKVGGKTIKVESVERALEANDMQSLVCGPKEKIMGFCA